ncbi:hypothetical protein RT21_19285 [Pseudomonas sp. 10B238]|nr:hypothetical protein RT21_19285 [Pseudomonas sp. 10B238]MAL34753.1 hypothetical protein [Pseudomonas sp.]HBM09599.1 hypothetical protein [Pseudomonas sp.]
MVLVPSTSVSQTAIIACVILANQQMVARTAVTATDIPTRRFARKKRTETLVKISLAYCGITIN